MRYEPKFSDLWKYINFRLTLVHMSPVHYEGFLCRVYVPSPVPLQLLEESLEVLFHDAVQHSLWLSLNLHNIIAFLVARKSHKGLGQESRWGRGPPHFWVKTAVQTKLCGLACSYDAEVSPESNTCPTSCLKHLRTPCAELLIHSLTFSKSLMSQAWLIALIRLD
jgi:hypothetical protein